MVAGDDRIYVSRYCRIDGLDGLDDFDGLDGFDDLERDSNLLILTNL